MNPFAPTKPGFVDVVGVVAALGGVTLGLWVLWKLVLRSFSARERTVIGWFLALLCLVTLAFGWLAIGTPVLRSIFVADAAAYHHVILELGDGLLAGERPTDWTDRSVYLYGVAAAQSIFGQNGYVSVVVNVFLVGIAMLLTVDLARLLAGRGTAVATAVLVALLPALPLWSATPIREALVICLTVLAVNGAVRAARDGWWWALALLATLLMVRTRGVQVIALAAALAVAAAYFTWDRVPPPIRRRLRSRVVVIGACLCMLTVSVAFGPELHRTALSVAEQSQTTTANLQRIAESPTTPTLDRNAPTNPGALASRTPAALVSYLWGPGPTAEAPKLMVVEAASLWLLTPIVLLGGGMAVARRERLSLIPVAAAVVAALLGALTLGNYGIISRMRLSTWLLLLPFAGLALSEVWAHRRSSGAMWARRVQPNSAENNSGN